MSELETRFEAAAVNAKNLPARPDNESMLQLYSLYKQATVGDVTGKRRASPISSAVPSMMPGKN